MRQSALGGVQISGKNVDMKIMLRTYTEAEDGIKMNTATEPQNAIKLGRLKRWRRRAVLGPWHSTAERHDGKH